MLTYPNTCSKNTKLTIERDVTNPLRRPCRSMQPHVQPHKHPHGYTKKKFQSPIGLRLSNKHRTNRHQRGNLKIWERSINHLGLRLSCSVLRTSSQPPSSTSESPSSRLGQERIRKPRASVGSHLVLTVIRGASHHNDGIAVDNLHRRAGSS
jgi:hypothetical protein